MGFCQRSSCKIVAPSNGQFVKPRLNSGRWRIYAFLWLEKNWGICCQYCCMYLL